ncbi:MULTISPECIES: anthranilate phosphoribosyltransferase [Sulfurisphaera]|uniref:Anthranilate phosphoribosyltransferase n=3 Tax=Sulfurisphaera TaxID=69655 RepID=TRPD_SULTO|nr:MULTISPECIES: anthranilate phosphoribosyltransferase [Sulfurisphaera]Q971Z7.1 RecName: Full=Anthranilate phosphoribosyltransferase [Sulfurisphaera tokodaii str. 7]MBB5252578.1 anthranilate phosphoribosyltransferase [Sulfurisphaera ohwakuensis]QGR16979.1 anthranilate phosphoribosyltransferase [Sulfurisphaera ohwakuensis]BAB66272.1 anthranilate phosphoribosyltransferase [Sulfurisphaera tokodaii str. 7]HII73253.1 anthranilate phosphoribosyltransferase [Sulfurisphaera tokodaii]
MNTAELLRKIIRRENLTEDEARSIANSVMKAEVPEIVTAGFLVGLATKGESVEEITGFAKAMRDNALHINFPSALDTAGTGGDGLNTLNVSTAVALLISQVYPVAKHGNRAVSGKSGSADVLEALGYNIIVKPELAEKLIKESKFVFLFAQLYHPAMKNVANVRKTLGVRTIFNVLGPLTNPANARYQMIGVFSKEFLPKLAEAVVRLDYDRVILYNGFPSLDEISTQGITYVYEIEKDKIVSYTVSINDFGLKDEIPVSKLTVNDATHSALRILKAFKGKDEEARRFIGINTAMALYLIRKVKDLKDGYEYALQLMDSGIPHVRSLIEKNGDLSNFNKLVEKID